MSCNSNEVSFFFLSLSLWHPEIVGLYGKLFSRRPHIWHPFFLLKNTAAGKNSPCTYQLDGEFINVGELTGAWRERDRCSPIAVFIPLKCPAREAQSEKRKWSRRKIRCLSAVGSLVCVISGVLMKGKKKLFIFSLCEVPRLHVVLSATFRRLQVSASVPLVLLARRAWKTHSQIFMKPPPPLNAQPGVSANFPALKDLILKANNAGGASRSWSRNNATRLFITASFAGSRLSVSGTSVWLAAGDPCASKIHWSRANIRQSARDQPAEGGAISPGSSHAGPFGNRRRLLSTWRKMFVVARPANAAAAALIFSPFLLPYHCFNALCRGKRNLGDPLGLWHFVFTISPRRRRDLWSGSHTCTWVSLKPPAKATWP